MSAIIAAIQAICAPFSPLRCNREGNNGDGGGEETPSTMMEIEMVATTMMVVVAVAGNQGGTVGSVSMELVKVMNLQHHITAAMSDNKLCSYYQTMLDKCTDCGNKCCDCLQVLRTPQIHSAVT